MATLDEITSMIEKDSVIDQTQLTNALVSIPNLVSKYYRMYVDEVRLLAKIECDFNEIYKAKFDYYLGYADDAEYAKKTLNRKVLKTDVSVYIKADPDVSLLYQKRTLQEQKVKFIEGFIKELHSRNFLIKNIIENEKFKNGGY